MNILTRTCALDKCSEKYSARGLCKRHYTTWNDMVGRCHNTEHSWYSSYGGRGIAVCDKWRHNPLAFYKDMGIKPTLQHSLERVDNDGDYEPSNCKWGTKTEQVRNRRVAKNNTTGIKGVHFDTSRDKWMTYITINRKMKNLGRFDLLEDAVSARMTAEELYYL